MLAQTVDKDNGGNGGSDRVPGLCKDLMTVFNGNPFNLVGVGGSHCESNCC